MNKGLRSTACLISVLVVLGPACLKQGANRVGMKRVGADLAYGVSPLSQVAAPPGAIPQLPAEPPDEFPLTLTPRPPGVRPPALNPCREAGPNDFPEEPAPNDVTTRPKEGRFLWTLKGTFRPLLIAFDLPLLGFPDRVIGSVLDDPANPGNPKNFVFKTTERDPVAPETVLTQSFLVDQANPTPRLRGLFLTEIVRKSDKDGTVRTFRPVPAIMYFPLPVERKGQEFRSAGASADPNDRAAPTQSLLHEGKVKDRIRIDVCGKVVDSWYVEATQTHVVGQESRRVRFNYAIAPQLGALSIFEHITSPCPEAEGPCSRPPVYYTYDRTIRQTEPLQ